MRAIVFFALFLTLTAKKSPDEPSSSVECNGDDVGDNAPVTIDCTSDTDKPIPFPNLTQAVASSPAISSNQSAGNVAIVETLYFTGNSLEIPDNAFSAFKGLRQLTIDFSQADDNLEDNQAPPSVTIKPNAFSGLEKALTTLELIGINFNKPLPVAVRSLTALQILQLTDCNFKGQLRSSDLQNLKNLKQLIITGSPNLSIADDAFSNNADNLERLHLGNVKLLNLSSSISSLKNLQEIHIRATELKSLPANAFKNSGSTLKTVHLPDNDISDIDPDAFKGLSGLTVLVLSGNEIVKLPSGVFDDLVSLRTMQLSNNNLTSDALKNAFSALKQLVQLSLDGNFLDSVTPEMLTGIENNVRSLFLSQNAIRSVRGTAKLTQSPQLILSSNGIEILKVGFFESGSTFSELYLTSNPITSIQAGAFNGVTIRGILSIDDTDLVEFDLSSLSGLKGVENFTIANSRNLRTIKVSSASSVPPDLKTITAIKNPKFILTDPDGQLISYLQKSKVRLIISGDVFCHCLLVWLRDKFPKANERNAIIAFETVNDQTDDTTVVPADCCNENLTVDAFLTDSEFNLRCGGTKGNATVGESDSCPIGFDYENTEA